MRKLNILVLAAGAYVSGAEKVTIDVMEGLQNMGHSIFCVTNGWNNGDFPSRLEKMKIKFKEINLGWLYIRKPSWTLDSLINLPGGIFKFINFVKGKKIDVIYASNFRQVFLLYFLLNRPIIFHVHDSNSTNKISKSMIKIINKKVVKFIAISKFIENDLINCGITKDKISVIYNGISPSNKVEFNSFNDNTLNLGIIGQVSPRKGHEDLIDALAIIKKQGITKIKLIIVGKGDQYFTNYLKSKINFLQLNDWVEWRGFKEKIEDIYYDIDVVVTPTRDSKPFGLTPLEANSIKIPVIVSECSGLVEFISDGVNGFLIKPNSPIDIAEKIIKLYDNTELRIKMGENGFFISREHFSLSITVEKINNLLLSFA